MVRWFFLIGVVLLLALRGVALSAGAGPAEVYIKFSAKADSIHSCPAIRDSLASHAPVLSSADCQAMRGAARTFRLRWEYVSPALLNGWLSAETLRRDIEWYEFAGGGLRLQAAGPSTFYTRLLAAIATPDTPSFLSDEALRLQNLLRIYKPAGLVTIAIIDSGVNFESARLTRLQAVNTAEVPGNGVDDDSNGYIDDVAGWDFVDEGFSSWFDDTQTPDNEPKDLLGHGSALASIATATAGPDAANWLRILPLRVASGTNGVGAVSPFALAEAIHYATAMGAQVINLSVGSVQSYNVVTDAINEALTLGVQVVVAAGNSSGGVLFPAGLPGVLAVGALDASGQIWSGSARGPGVAVYMRGTDMLNELGSDFSGLSRNGTSFAAPSATGMAAMLWAVAGDCESTALSIHQSRPADQSAGGWISAPVNQFESDAQATDDLAQRWTSGQTVCSAHVTVAALLRRSGP